jgi:hypothetical protein
MGNLETSRARETKSDRRLRATLIAVAAVVVAGLGVAAWLLTAPPPAATAPPAASSERTAGPQPGAPAVEGSEVLPPDESAQSPQRLPDIEPAAPRVSAPLPASGSAEGALVEGYPADLAPPTADAELIDSTVSSDGGVMQFSLRARTSADADAVLAHYRALWTGLGLAPAPGGGVDEGMSYGDDYSSVTVAARTGGTGLVYTIYGVLRTA